MIGARSSVLAGAIFLALGVVGCATGAGETRHPSALVGLWVSSGSPVAVGDETLRESRIVQLCPDGTAKVVDAFLIMGDRPQVSEGDGIQVYEGQWRAEASLVTVRYRFRLRFPETFPPDTSDERTETTGIWNSRTLVLDGRRFERAALNEESLRRNFLECR